jgi:aryl-alcohol dehydrogenase-like predicted oxidoreductase
LAALGRPGYINLEHAADLEGNYDEAAMQAHTHQVLDAAWQAGVRYFDAARSYGKAEEFLGSWLSSRKIPGVEVTVGSKWGYTYTAGWQVEAEQHEVKEHSLSVLQRQWRESQANLGAYLRLYQVHSATLDSGIFENQDVLQELGRFKSAGIYIGLTLSGPAQAQTLESAMEITTAGSRLFDCVQATWNLLEPSAGPALQRAHRQGMGIIIKEALANGRLTGRNTDPAFAAKLAILEAQAGRLDTSIDALALAAVLNQPWVDVVLSGAARIEHLHSNLRALHVRWDEEAETSLAALPESQQGYWETRSSLEWN